MRTLRLRSRVTYANLASTLALTAALSTGGAYAAGQIGASDIKDDAVKTRHLADSSVRKPDIMDGAVTRAKLASGATADKTVVMGKVLGAQCCTGKPPYGAASGLSTAVGQTEFRKVAMTLPRGNLRKLQTSPRQGIR